MDSRLLTLQARGLLALPVELRRRHRLEQGSQVEVVEREDGVIELHPQVSVPASQAWFWSERWQRMEREVDEQAAAGEVRAFESSEEFAAFLDGIESDE